MMDSKLVSIYYELISQDHHKSRDLCFLIEANYRDGKVEYWAHHPGYISEFSADVGSMEEGWDFLNTELAEAIRDQIEGTRETLAMTKEERESCWLLDPLLTEADLIEFEAYLDSR